MPDRVASALETQRSGYERLQAAVTALADLLDRDFPDLPDAFDDDEGQSAG